MAYMAPFETFHDLAERERSGAIYNDEFISKCREKALEYDRLDPILRAGLLQDLYRCLPVHRREYVFDGITNWERRG